MRSGLTVFGRWSARARTPLLTIAAFSCIVAGLWLLLGLAAGLIATGCALFLIEALGGDR